MRKLIPLLLLLALPARAQTYSDWGGPVAVRTTTMSTATVSKTIVLGEAATQVWIQGYNLSDIHGDGAEKAAVRVNGGSWQPFTNANANINCDSFFDALLGNEVCFNWKQDVVSFKLTQAFNSGSNTVEFRITPNTLSNNYYIIGFVPLASDGLPATLTTDFTGEGVTDSFTGGTASTGSTLWDATSSLVEYPGGPSIAASCQTCHMTDGAHDLKQFQFSNEAIVKRAQFHGLTEAQGEHIAAHVRAQTLTNDNATSHTATRWPWDPPYQPASGLSDGTSLGWLDGGGLNSVLHGTGSDGYSWTRASYSNRRAAVFGADGITEDDWTSPIPQIDQNKPFQWPTWSKWWPEIACVDGCTGGTNSKYANMLTHWNNAYSQSGQQLWNTLGSFSSEAQQLKNQGFVSFSPFSIARSRVGALGEVMILRLRLQHDLHINSLHESFVTYKENVDYFTLANSNRAEPFDRAPHILETSNQSNPYYYGDFNWMSMVWYDVSVALNDGRGVTTINATNPIDMGYTFGFAGAAKDPFVTLNYLRMQPRILAVCPPTAITNAGDRPGLQQCAYGDQTMYFWWHWELISGDSRFGDGMTPDDDAKFISWDIKYRSTKMSRWVPSDYVRSPYNNQEESNAAGGGTTTKYWPVTVNPALDKNYAFNNKVWQLRYDQDALAYHIRGYFESNGVACEAIDLISGWGESIYPVGDWESYTCTSGNTWPTGSNPPPTLGWTNPSGGQAYQAGQTITGQLGATGGVDSVLVALQKGVTTLTTAADSTAVLDGFLWTFDAGLTPDNDYRFVATSSTGNLTAYSNQFSIVSAPTAPDSIEAQWTPGSIGDFVVKDWKDGAANDLASLDPDNTGLIAGQGTPFALGGTDYGPSIYRPLHGYTTYEYAVDSLAGPHANSYMAAEMRDTTATAASFGIIHYPFSAAEDSMRIRLTVRQSASATRQYLPDSTGAYRSMRVGVNDCFVIRHDGGVMTAYIKDACVDGTERVLGTFDMGASYDPDYMVFSVNPRSGVSGTGMTAQFDRGRMKRRQPPDVTPVTGRVYTSGVVWSNYTASTEELVTATIPSQYYPDNTAGAVLPGEPGGACFYKNGVFNRCDETGPNEGSVYQFFPRVTGPSGTLFRVEWTDTGGVERYHEFTVQ